MSLPQHFSDEILLSFSDSDDDDKASASPTLNLQAATLNDQSWNDTDERSRWGWWFDNNMQTMGWFDNSMVDINGMMAWMQIASNMHAMDSDWQQWQTPTFTLPPPPAQAAPPPPPPQAAPQPHVQQPPWNSWDAVTKYAAETVKLAKTVMTKGIRHAKDDDLTTLTHRCYHMDTFMHAVAKVVTSKEQRDKDLMREEINLPKKEMESRTVNKFQ